jgi:hypothetical protein
MRQFLGYDNGVYTNGAWQMHLGYQPYEDLMGGFPPLFFLGAKWAFGWFGVKWFSLVKLGGLFAAATLLIHTWLLSRVVGCWWALSVACFTQSVTSLLTSAWCHDWPSAVIAALFFSAVLAWRAQPDRVTLAAVFLLGAVLLISKVNYAGLFYVLSLVALIAADLLAPKIGIRKIVVLFGSMIPAAVAILLAFHISPVALVRNYREAGDRAWSGSHAISYLFMNYSWELKQTLVLLLPALVCVVYLCSRWCMARKYPDSFELTVRASKKEAAWLVLLAIGPPAAFVAKATNNGFRMQELSPVVIALVGFYVMFRDSRWTWFRKIAVAGLVLGVAGVGGNALRLSVTRLTQAEDAAYTFYDPRNLVPISGWPYLDGLMAGPKLAVVLRDLEGILRDQGYLGDPNAKVYIGPRIDFAYAVFGIRPVSGLPLWWECYSVADLPKTQAMVERFKQAGFERIILLLDDHTYFPESLVQYLHSSYSVSTRGLLTVYRKL